MTTHLLIPDSHAMPGVSNRRYKWLNRLIKDRKPDVIINIGDHWDMPSLCHYDEGTVAGEGARVSEDIKVGKEGLLMITEGLKERAKKVKGYGNKPYVPRLVFTCGNHEWRLDREGQNNPKFHGMFSAENLGIEAAGWEFYEYLTPVVIDGISYCHQHTAGKMGKPISSMYLAAQLVKKRYMSCSQGHSHWWNIHCEALPDGRKLMGLEGGVYLDPDQWMDYAGQGNHCYWNGVTLKHEVDNGSYEIEQIGIKRIMEKYARKND